MIKKDYMESTRMRTSFPMIGIVLSGMEKKNKVRHIMKECKKRFGCTYMSMYMYDQKCDKLKLCFTNKANREQLIEIQKRVFAVLKSKKNSEPVILDKILYQPIIARREVFAVLVMEGILNPERMLPTSKYAENVEELTATMDILNLQECLRRSAKTDQLTMVANETQLREDLQKCRKVPNCIFAVVKINEIDIINTKCGIFEGNNVIVEVSKILTQSVEDGEGVYRLIGNAFGLILFGDYKSIYYKMIDLCSMVRNSGIETADGIIRVHISIGMVELRTCAELDSVDDLYKKAIDASNAENGGVAFYGDRKEKENSTENSILMGVIKEPVKNKKTGKRTKTEKNTDIPRTFKPSQINYFELFGISSSSDKKINEGA